LAGEIIIRYNNVSAELVPFHFTNYFAHKTRLRGLVPQPFANIDFRKAYFG
jgi:hypothetical protein